MSIGEQAEMIYQHAANIAYARELDLRTPSMMLRPRLSIDGNAWCALYGDDLQNGVAGFGSSPYAAFLDFDRSWFANLPAASSDDARGGGET